MNVSGIAVFAVPFIIKERCILRNVKTFEVPIWEKTNLTVEEAAAYSGIGVTKIKDLSNDERCPFVLWNGTKRLIKRRRFDEYLESQYSI